MTNGGFIFITLSLIVSWLSHCTAREVEKFTPHVNVARYLYNPIQIRGLLEDKGLS